MLSRAQLHAAAAIAFLILSLAPLTAQPRPPFLGIQTHFGQDRPDPDTAMARIQAAGIGAIRDEIYWHEVETSPGVFVFQPKHDAAIAAALSRGLQPLIILDYGHPLYGGTPRDSVGRAAFARYGAAVVARYAPLGVKHVEVWNEPNLCLPEFCPWSPSPSPVEYVALLKEVYAAIKLIDPSVIVLAGATSPLDEPETSQKIPGVSFIERMMQLGAGSFCDAISFHQYPVNRPPEDWLPSEVARIRAVAPGRRYWITEVGHHTASSFAGVSEAVQAQWLIRAVLVGQGLADLDRLSWYDLQDDCGDGGNAECRYGILRMDGTPKPAYTALQVMNELVGRRVFTGLANSGGTYEASFGGADTVVRVVWTTSGSAIRSVAIPTPYARITTMLGSTSTIVGTSGGSISVTATEMPSYVVAMPDGPAFDRLDVNPGSCILDSSQSVQFESAALTPDSIRVPLAPSTVVWHAVGSAVSVTTGGIVSAVHAGEATVIGTLGVLADTARVRVVAPRGSYDVGPMTSALWTMRSELMDTTGTFLALPATGPGLELRYRLTYAQANANKYLARLQPAQPMMIPGRADTIRLWANGDGQNHVVVFQVGDRDAEWFPTLPRRVTWAQQWRPVSARINQGSGRFDLPAEVAEIDVYLIPAVAPPDGTILDGLVTLDSLQASFIPRAATPVVDETERSAASASMRSYPNPFNPSTTIRYVMPVAGRARLEVFDLLGRCVALLGDGPAEAGEHEILWDGASCPSGVYVARLVTDRHRAFQRLVLAR